MTVPSEEQDLAERIAHASSRKFAQYWLAECAKMEEQIVDPGARWEILRTALERIAREAPSV